MTFASAQAVTCLCLPFSSLLFFLLPFPSFLHLSFILLLSILPFFSVFSFSFLHSLPPSMSTSSIFIFQKTFLACALCQAYTLLGSEYHCWNSSSLHVPLSSNRLYHHQIIDNVWVIYSSRSREVHHSTPQGHLSGVFSNHDEIAPHRILYIDLLRTFGGANYLGGR